jgi:ParB family chromosome partitioning protein
MLGKGLESLIPPKAGNGQENNGNAVPVFPVQPNPAPAFMNPNSHVDPFASSADADPMSAARNVAPEAFTASPAALPINNPVPEPMTPRPESPEPVLSAGSQAMIPEIKTSPILREIRNPVYDDDPAEKKSEAVFQIEVEKIVPNPEQPRRHFDEESLRELASSIREFGIIQPLIVSKVSEETESGTEVHYELIAGERRLMAAKMVGLRTVPAIVKHVSVGREKLELAVIENIQRSDLNPIEEARAYARLQDEFRMTQREIASRLGKSRETVANAMRLLNLPSEVQTALETGQLNESQGRLLLQIGDIKRQMEIFYSILTDKPSVRALKQRIREEVTPKSEARSIDPTLEAIKSRLEEILGTKVDIRTEGDKGKITINFYSSEELSSLIDKLVRQNDNRSL